MYLESIFNFIATIFNNILMYRFIAYNEHHITVKFIFPHQFEYEYPSLKLNQNGCTLFFLDVKYSQNHINENPSASFIFSIPLTISSVWIQLHSFVSKLPHHLSSMILKISSARTHHLSSLCINIFAWKVKFVCFIQTMASWLQKG